ncbi:MAG TPA: DinB family protein [Actinopolymorphaceae bacterium]|jgi:hypothetical protein
MTFATDLVELSDYAYNRLRDRLDGIDDAEFAWEPVPGSWTLREQPDGTFAPDGNDESGSHAYAPPLTTLAWWVWHIIDFLEEDRTATWFGLDVDDVRGSVPGTAADALNRLDRAAALWHERLSSLDDAGLAEPVGDLAGPYGEASRNSFALHILDELIHHAAEVALLRDLYRAQHD